MRHVTSRMGTVAPLLVAVACGCSDPGPDLESFRQAAQRTLERSRRAVDQARRLDAEPGVPGIPAGPFDARALRLDEATHAVSVARSVPDPRLPAPVLAGWDAGPDGWRVAEDRPIDLEIAPTSRAVAGALRMRVVVPEGEDVRLRVVLRGAPGDAAVVVRPHLVSDGRSREYLVDLRPALDRATGGPLRALVLGVESGGSLRLHALELLSRRWRYEDRSGRGHERVRGDMRPVVYLSGRGALTWELTGAWEDARLHFGLAAVMPGRSVRASVTLSTPSGERRLAEVDLDGTGPWIDRAVAIGRIPVDGARLVLTVDGGAASSAGDNVVLLGAPVLWEPPRRRLNVVIILEDALRADRMSVYGHFRDTTPYKRELFADGARFERGISQATKTRFSCASMMTSLRPLATGVFGLFNPNVRLQDAYLTLPEVLAAHGWATASFHQNSNAGSDNGLHQGFETVVENIPGTASGVYSGPVLEWLQANRERNVFVYLHVADPHEPYRPPPAERRFYESLVAVAGRPLWQDPAWVADARGALYDGEVAANDAALPPLIGRLDELGLLDDTLLLFLADHGEHLGEHDLWSHNPPSYLQVVHVPLLARLPGRVAPGVVVEQPVQNLDIVPTILDLAGLDASTLPLQGRSLAPLLGASGASLPPEVAVVQDVLPLRSPQDERLLGSLFWERWHFLHSVGTGSVVFDHRADPREELPLRPSRALERSCLEVMRELRRLDEETRDLLEAGSSDVVEINLDAVDNLKALGYLPE